MNFLNSLHMKTKNIYTKPVKLNKGDEVTYVAGRIGYKNSDRKTLKY